MLQNSFLHLPGIGHKTEVDLWRQGIVTWTQFERALKDGLLRRTGRSFDKVKRALDASREALLAGNTDYFARLLPKSEHFRIALTVPEKTLFVDIETTGLSHYYDKITVVGVGKLDKYQCHIAGTNAGEIIQEIQEASCLVTFNGTLFDLKFLQKEFPRLRLPEAHVDLRFFARSVGYKGGQKEIEAQIGLKRDADVQAIVGERAPLLWHNYRLGDLSAVKLLVEYNFADIEGMKAILDHVIAAIAKRGACSPLTNGYQRFAAKSPVLRWTSRAENARKNRIYIPRYSGKRGPLVTYDELAGSQHRNLRVVGIDLTGSESRPSGWCLLKGDQASTHMLRSDLEILVETQRARPDIVSIDSPLSLPRGRLHVQDTDPGRESFGIVRECERVLMQRGVNVYPCLIQSMQALTARGIRLAGAFRRLGIPVIESYPGAAQDIMAIPRKRAGLEHLKQGLSDFGIRGTYIDNRVTHDELDAITAAIVGLFFWSGMYEALGNEDEDYLIIPDLHASPNRWNNRHAVALSGSIASGKSTAALYLRQKGYKYARFSEILARLLGEQSKPVTRQTLQDFGAQVHHIPGQRWLCKRLLLQVRDHDRVVIDGLRFPEDVATLVEAYGPSLDHFYLTADVETRKQRYLKIGQSVDTFRKASAHHIEDQVPALRILAEHTLTNNASLKRLYDEIDAEIRTSRSHRRK